jgi:hypothetical protein
VPRFFDMLTSGLLTVGLVSSPYEVASHQQFDARAKTWLRDEK